jgi:hypothetical protein
MNLGRWLRTILPPKQHGVPARWLRPSENLWGLLVLDCTQNAAGMISTTRSPEIARKYGELREASGQELPGAEFKPIQSVLCNLTYKIENRPAEGPVFKSRMMEEKWDIYWYDERLFFCRSWGGELIYRATAKCEPPTLTVLMVESIQRLPEKMAVRQADFLVKSHLMSAVALHPLPEELGLDAEKQALYSFGYYGRRGLYGTLEETIGTAYHWNRFLLAGR